MAEKTFLKTLDIDPDNSYAYNKLGILAKHESQYSKAIRYFQQAIEKCSCDFNALQNLGHTYHIMKEYDKALSVYQEAKIFQPQHATLNYYIAALTGKNLEKAPLAYIESLYDEYAKQINNDFSVESEDYPIAKQIIDIITPMSHTLNNKIILDLGCGQGTFGKFYKRNYPNHHIVGIDISTKMLELARKTSSYHELVHKDFMHYLKTQSNIGMIIASDSLSYIGKLNVFLISAYHALSTNGILALSIAASTKKAYMLNKDGRFYHHSDTIETICKQLGFILAHKEETLFANIQPTPTFGYILTFRKT